jgi:hypothetical protein
MPHRCLTPVQVATRPADARLDGDDALDDYLDLSRAFEKADAELGARIDRLTPIEAPGNEAGWVINDAALDQLAELAKVRRKAWDAYIACVEKQPAVSVDANTRRSRRPSLFPWPHGSLTVG